MARRADPETDTGSRADYERRTYMIRGHPVEAPALAAGLYVVATPIGNLGDITLRALDTLVAADLIACEDTRVTQKLLTRYGIKSRLISYHDYSDNSRIIDIIEHVQAGKSVALVSDAGTPLVSDPGYRLIGRLRDAGLDVIPVPGASSVLAAVSAAGLPTDAVHFAGFIAPKSSERRRRLGDLARLKATIVLMESAARLGASLKDAADIFGGGAIACVCRELTKLHETFDRAPLAELAERYGGQGKVKGEIILLIASGGIAREWSDDDIDALLSSALKTLSVRRAADQVAAETGQPRRAIYQRALALKDSDIEA